MHLQIKSCIALPTINKSLRGERSSPSDASLIPDHNSHSSRDTIFCALGSGGFELFPPADRRMGFGRKILQAIVLLLDQCAKAYNRWIFTVFSGYMQSLVMCSAKCSRAVFGYVQFSFASCYFRAFSINLTSYTWTKPSRQSILIDQNCVLHVGTIVSSNSALSTGHVTLLCPPAGTKRIFVCLWCRCDSALLPGRCSNTDSPSRDVLHRIKVGFPSVGPF
jgi:hypothetical protein